MGPESIGAAGELASGALLARVVEPSAGEALQGRASSCCLNCGAALATRYCGGCGQSAHVHTTLSSIGHDLLHGLFHVEGKIWRTVPDLIIRPGELTRRYIAGERAKFVSPLALFLFAVFLMLATFESVGGPFHPQAIVVRNGQQLSPVDVDHFLSAAQKREVDLRQKLAAAPPNSTQAKIVQSELDDVHEEARGLEIAHHFNAQVTAASLNQLRPATGWASLDRRINEVTANPPLLAVKLQANAHKFAWALIPLSVPFLWIVFVRQRSFRLYDHTVFIIYALSAVMLLLAALALLAATGLPTGWALLLIPIHQYRQLRGAYGVTRWGALWRAVWLQLSAIIVLSSFGFALLASGLIG